MTVYEYNKERKAPTISTIKQNQELARKLGIDAKHAENEELLLSKSHCLRALPELNLKNEAGEVIWRHDRYQFLDQEEIPESVNPSLWLNCRSLYMCGVFSVVGKDIVQVRGFDLANITFVRTKNGWLVVDAGSTVEGSKAALLETEKALGETIQGKIKAVIISHSHGDHFGGIAGIVSPEQVGPSVEGKIPIYVAKGFDEATRDEYVYIGNAMNRRSHYQVGAGILPNAQGKVSVGCGLDTVGGTTSYIHPTDYIVEDCTKVIDGITVDFQLANETEAVANMLNYFHEYKALWVADNCIGTLHNLYTIRGAKVRDAKLWVQSLYDAYYRYKDKANVVFQGHACPHWNTEQEPDAVGQVLLNHAAIYQYTHDQTLGRMTKGDTANEIARELTFPEQLTRQWYLRPYYGTYENNVRAIYNKYLGYYDGNPIHLNPLTPTKEAQKFIEYVGSEERVLELAQKDFEKGEYQFAASTANAVVFANPENVKARYLCADALEQLGYQSESAIFRNAYLLGAKELRELEKDKDSGFVRWSAVLHGMEPEQLLDYLGMVFDGALAADIQGENYLTFEDNQTFYVQIYAGVVLKHRLSEEEKKQKNPYVKEILVTREQFIAYIQETDADAHPLLQESLWIQVKEYVENMDLHGQFHIVEP